MKQLLTFLLAAFLISCGNAQQQDASTAVQQEIKNVNNTEAQALISDVDGLQIIDVRTDGECAQGMINGATQIDIGSADFEQKIEALDKEGKYLVYCRSGARSARAMQIMKDKGFTHVYNLKGGYMNWSK